MAEARVELDRHLSVDYTTPGFEVPEDDTAEKDAPLMGAGRPTIYGDYVAPAVASPNSPWHIQGDEGDLALCGKRLTGSLRRMNLHVCLLECSRCMSLGGR